MAITNLKPKRNLTLECCKLIAACFVVFIHVPFPWQTGEIVICLARFAVPMFFAISGWYSYRVTGRKLLNRMGHMLMLELAGIVIMNLWWLAAAKYTGADLLQSFLKSIPDSRALVRWVLFNDDPYGGQLWYLSASAFVYGAFWLYNQLTGGKWGYRPAYVVGLCLLAAHFVMGELSVFTGLEIYSRNYRTGLCMGLPLFLMGLFLREHREQLLNRLKARKLTFLLLLGLGITLVEWKFFGNHDMYLGLLVEVPALLLLTSLYPGVPKWMESIAGICGSLSLGIYLVHFAMLDIYLGFFQWRIQQYFPSAEPWLQPWCVLALSGAAALAWVIPMKIWKQYRKKISV